MSPCSPRRAQRQNAPFTKEQETWIILEYGASRNCLAVRRKFRHQFKVNPRKVPLTNAFQRLVDRFIETQGELRPRARSGGRPPFSDELVQRVKDFLLPFYRQKRTVSVTTLASSLNISFSMAWRIARKKLGWYPYKPRTVVPLSPAHKVARLAFCDWLLMQPDGFEDQVIWSDEKWFLLKQAPNKQNERYWGPCDPEVEVECREQGGQKVMCWAGVINGQIIIHWFDPGMSVNGQTYLNMLQTVVWPQVKAVATRKSYWFQQDGATVHTTVAARSWLQQKFGDRVISRLTAHPWPAKSPDLSPLDYWFWDVAMADLRKTPPASLRDLKTTVEALADSMEEEEVSRAVQHLRCRAKACAHLSGAPFEAQLAKLRK